MCALKITVWHLNLLLTSLSFTWIPFLKEDGVMAIILPHGVLFRSSTEARIRTKLLKDGHIDTIIGLPANLFFSTGIPVCILVLKKCKKPDDILFINAAEHFDKGKRQNQISSDHIKKLLMLTSSAKRSHATHVASAWKRLRK